jgi:glycosyltransferase involved in cell wall biosynthesis
MSLLVLGMHRSGTSAVTRLLNLAGAYFGPEAIATEPNEENPKGFWERRDVRAICDGLLQESGFDWWKLTGFSPDAIPDDVRTRWTDAFAEVVSDLDAHRPWVLKEPRLCLLAPVLLAQVTAPVAVHVVREPLEVARSMHQRDGFPVQAALALWELYTVSAFAASESVPRLVVHHEQVLADPVAATAGLLDGLGRLGVEGLSMPPEADIVEFVAPELHRQRSPASARGARLNAEQAALAQAIDDGTILGRPSTSVSDGALDDLAHWERTRALEAQVDQLETEQARRTREHAEQTRRLELDVASAQRRLANAEDKLSLQSTYRETELARRREIGRQADEALAHVAKQLERLEASRVGRLAAGMVGLRQTLTPGAARTTAGPFTPPLRDLAERRRDLAALALQEPAPGGTSEVLFPTENPLVRRTRPRRAKGSASDRPSVAVVSWDVGHNPLGRANVLAEVLDRHYDVELWGAQFERYGSQIWAPLRRASVPINVFDGSELPQHVRTIDKVVAGLGADAVWVSKPRLPSYLFGIQAKLARNRPLVLDVDDHELSFFAEDEGLDLDELDGWSREELKLPFERGWTRLCDTYIEDADALTVSNVALQARYGGTIVPHARDELRFDPSRIDREAVRARLEVRPDERLLLFGGTPRAHKGVVEVLEALERLGDDRYRVLMFGTREFDELRHRIGDLARWARVLPPQPFDLLPELVGAADLACVVQDPSHPVSPYQLPAKVFDALAMGVPCLVAPTPPLAPLVAEDVFQVLEPNDELHERIARVFDDPAEARERADRGRQIFLDRYSYAAVAQQVVPVFEQLLGNTPEPSPRLRELAGAPQQIMSTPRRTGPAQRPPQRVPRRDDPEVAPVPPGSVFDVAMFWKQNDSGLYGRRQDMILAELARSPRVGTIVHFDNPISPEELLAAYRAGSGPADQRRLVVRQTIERLAHRRDEPGVVRRTFLYGARRSRRLRLPSRARYISHVREELVRQGIGARPLVVWTYPSNPDLPGLIDALDPAVVVTDVVDDNRTWYEPGSPKAAEITENYAAVLARSDVVLANCEPVAEAMAPFAPEVHVVANACELPSPSHRPGPVPAVARGLGRPLLAYVGNLSSRFDVDLVAEVAKARPDWTIALVGSAHLDQGALALDRLPNVHVLGVLPYPQVRDLLAHVDVGLIPHVDNAMTRAMNPLKAFVYASAGVPVVATPVANLPDVGELITVAGDAPGFVAAIEHHLAAGRPVVDPELLRPHSWPERLARVFELIDDELAVEAVEAVEPD